MVYGKLELIGKSLIVIFRSNFKFFWELAIVNQPGGIDIFKLEMKTSSQTQTPRLQIRCTGSSPDI